ncbi:SRPBCC domain-containing protein [Nonomuraea angiospora]|uniref:SRPBCC domain-containing protein n=1 Tax=Nonomuraea angiospora TaxID=46172 RepID=UPI003328577C
MIRHATFVAEHVYAVPPVEVFSAWADPAVKARWAGGPPGWNPRLDLDFRVDGVERCHGTRAGGPAHTVQARYLDIVPSKRIVYSYDVLLDQVRVLVSLATIEFARHGPGTRIVHTEQAAFLTEDDISQFEQHIRAALKSLEAELGGQAPSATGRDAARPLGGPAPPVTRQDTASLLGGPAPSAARRDAAGPLPGGEPRP